MVKIIAEKKLWKGLQHLQVLVPVSVWTIDASLIYFIMSLLMQGTESVLSYLGVRNSSGQRGRWFDKENW